jgi:hypothetical protein
MKQNDFTMWKPFEVVCPTYSGPTGLPYSVKKSFAAELDLDLLDIIDNVNDELKKDEQ